METNLKKFIIFSKPEPCKRIIQSTRSLTCNRINSKTKWASLRAFTFCPEEAKKHLSEWMASLSKWSSEPTVMILSSQVRAFSCINTLWKQILSSLSTAQRYGTSLPKISRPNFKKLLVLYHIEGILFGVTKVWRDKVLIWSGPANTELEEILIQSLTVL